jgi:hypothetical protein
MTVMSKQVVARILRSEADNIRRHGLTNTFDVSFGCIQAQVLRTEKCEGCLLGDYVAQVYREEAFPCQFIDQEAWEQISDDPGLVDRVAIRFSQIADELEAKAQVEGNSAAESGSH